MLRDFDSTSMIPTRNLESARRFYEDVLQFDPIYENPGGITYRWGTTCLACISLRLRRRRSTP